MQKAITMIDREIDVALWLENSLAFVTKWKGKAVYFKQFNQSFIAMYNKLGKYGIEKIRENRKIKKVEPVKEDSPPVLTQKMTRKKRSFDRLNTLLFILERDEDHSDYNLIDRMNEMDMDIKSIANLRYYLSKLVQYKAIEHKAKRNEPRNVRVLKKELDLLNY